MPNVGWIRNVTSAPSESYEKTSSIKQSSETVGLHAVVEEVLRPYKSRLWCNENVYYGERK